MGDTLFGGVESGTPLETRQGTEALASMYQRMLQGDSGGMQKMMQSFQGGGQGFQNLFGISQGDAGVPGAVQSLLASPADRTKGLFASMRPFEQRQTNEAVSGVRNMFGTAGGRFSRNLGNAEARTRGELSNQFAQTRQQGLLQAQSQQGNFLAQLMNLANQNQQIGLQGMGQMSQFLAPGSPVYKEGMLPGLLSAFGNLAMAASGSGLFDGGGIPNTPNPVPQPGNPFGPGGHMWLPNQP